MASPVIQSTLKSRPLQGEMVVGVHGVKGARRHPGKSLPKFKKFP
jgi:hypothetical protein